MKNLELQKCILGPVYTNCYLLKNKETGELIIVDPADCPEKIEMKISRMNGKPVAILLTHGHFDHILAAQAVKEKYNIPIYACRQEEEMLREPSINMTVHYGQGCSIVPDVSGGSGCYQTGGIFRSDDPYTGTYQRKLLLLSER